MKRFFMYENDLRKNTDLLALVSTVRFLFQERVEPLPLRDVFHPADRTGYLAMTASEPADGVIDGWDRFRLPVTSLGLKAGYHEVVVTSRSGISRSFTLRIVPGETSTVHVLFENSDF